LAERFPSSVRVVSHHSIGGTNPLDANQLDRLKALIGCLNLPAFRNIWHGRGMKMPVSLPGCRALRDCRQAIGDWFHTASDALILGQRAIWKLLFLVLLLKGRVPFSADRFPAAAEQRLEA